jgi:hypothetical protein
MFIDTAINRTTRAPAERNVSADECATRAGFAPPERGGSFRTSAFYKHCVPTGRASLLEKRCQGNKKLARCFTEDTEDAQSNAYPPSGLAMQDVVSDSVEPLGR